MSQTGPQYHRGGSTPPESVGQTRPVPSSAEWAASPGQSVTPQAPPQGAQSGQQLAPEYPPAQGFPPPVASDPYSVPPANSGPRRGDTGETYGYDYRYADGMDEYYVQSNPAGWLALVLAILGAVMAWDRLGAVIALGILTLSFIIGLVALSLRGRRKWYVWIAVVLSVAGGLVALISVIVSVIALMGGLSFSGEAAILGVVNIPPVHIAPIDEITLSFPKSGLAFLKLG